MLQQSPRRSRLLPTRARPSLCQIETLESRLLCSAIHLAAKPHKQRHHPRLPPMAQAASTLINPPAGAGSSPSVIGRYAYYAGTSFFGDAYASDKTALLPGQTASFANVTTYAGGIDEVVLDVAGGSSFSAADFSFRAGISTDPASWAAAPEPASVTTQPGAGTGGTTRVTVKWADGAIANEWLQINFLPAGDTFYFGNLIGATSALQLTATDESSVRANPCTLLSPADIANPYDFNRDGKVDALDQLIARANCGNTIPLLAAPGLPAAVYDWHTQIIGGILNIWAPNPSDFGPTWTVTDPNALFGPTGTPHLESIHQGPIADCYFLSAEGTLAFSNPSRIQSLVSNDATGGWAVTFQWWNSTLGKYQPIVFHTSRELSTTLQFANGEVWSTVMEKAYAAFRTWNGVTSTNTMASLGWGYPASTLSVLNDASTFVYYRTMPSDAVYTMLQTALAAHQPILFQTSSAAATMVPSHVYVITNVSTDASGTAWITAYNPWGFYDTRTEADLLSNGIGTFVAGTT